MSDSWDITSCIMKFRSIMGFPELRFEPEEDQKHSGAQEQAAEMSKRDDSKSATSVKEVSKSSQKNKQVQKRSISKG